MWRDICVANRDRLLLEISAFSGELERLRALIEAGDGSALETVFAEAREARDRWIRSS
jgi:prephenate dehydrogenase